MAVPSRLRRQALGHSPDGCDLRRVLAEIIDVAIAPPVPTATRIDHAPRDLWEKDHEPVGVGVAGKAASLDKGVAHALPRLLAAMKCDMQPAAWMALAVRRDVNDSLRGEPIGHALAEGRLVENDELAGWG